MQRERTWLALWQLLVEWPGQHKRQLLTGLQRMGLVDVTTTDVNRLLYASPETFAHDGGTPRIWRLTDQARLVPLTAPITPATPRPRCYVGKAPRAWQAEAFAQWKAGGRCGVVEAVTGTGKTTVGVLAAAAAVEAGEKVLVLVPGRELLDQWHEVLSRDLRITRVGRVGDGHGDSFDDHQVLVATVHSAARYQMLRPGSAGLLIADEVHRYGAKTFAWALEPEFGARLGLTATYSRDDDGLEEHLEPYFGGVVMGCSYQRGLADGILAPFRVGFLGTDFTVDEREQYDLYDERARTLRGRLILDHGCPDEPFGEFMARVNELSQGGHGNRSATADARRYLHAFSKRRQLLADCRRKQEALASLAPVLAVADQGLVFGETKASAEKAAEVLCHNGVAALDFTSALHQTERKRRLAAFKHGQVKVLTAPRVLDEGIDVPQAEVGVIMAGSRSKRQMIQRMGRVIRPKADRRPATFFVLYARGTSEDPRMGAHEDFREQLTVVAQDLKDFAARTTLADLLRWYGEGRLMN